jgi:UDP:flavonoid glycosyltransferase YjiC (YdhE family)
MTLLADIPEYFPSKNLPENYHYIGPLTWKSNLSPPPWWPPEGNRPLIYFTMGTTGLSDVFQQVYDLIKNSDMTAIITTGAQTSKITTIKGKLYVESFIDGDLVMEHCDLVVCHGGNGTIYQALRYGKPVIGIPTVPDQQINMRRVEALGIGKTLKWTDISNNPETLLDLIREILGDASFQGNAEKLRRKIIPCDAARTAADLIKNLQKN